MNERMNTNIPITKETIKRLVNDIKQITKNPLTENGIYYHHDTEDMLKGYAMIVGPEDTPYFGGFYFFIFNFSRDYPYSPPEIVYCTNSNKIRFNPNLYVNGKVCISILNTHPSGDKWSACQNITSILLSLLTLFTKDPLLNEPGINKMDSDLIGYTESIRFANFNYALCDVVMKSPNVYNMDFFNLFETDVMTHFVKNYETILGLIKDNLKNNRLNNTSVSTRIYRMDVRINYEMVLEKYEGIRSLTII